MQRFLEDLRNRPAEQACNDFVDSRSCRGSLSLSILLLVCLLLFFYFFSFVVMLLLTRAQWDSKRGKKFASEERAILRVLHPRDRRFVAGWRTGFLPFAMSQEAGALNT